MHLAVRDYLRRRVRGMSVGFAAQLALGSYDSEWLYQPHSVRIIATVGDSRTNWDSILLERLKELGLKEDDDAEAV